MDEIRIDFGIVENMKRIVWFDWDNEWNRWEILICKGDMIEATIYRATKEDMLLEIEDIKSSYTLEGYDVEVKEHMGMKD